MIRVEIELSVPTLPDWDRVLQVSSLLSHTLSIALNESDMGVVVHRMNVEEDDA